MSSVALSHWLIHFGVLILLQSINGTSLSFPAYSHELQNFLSISRIQLNLISVASDAGKFFGFISGVATHHFPIWAVLVIGSLIGFVGYGLQCLILVKSLSPPFMVIWVLNFLAGNSVCWITTVCGTMATGSFPANVRHVVLGITTSYFALSPRIYTDVAELLWPHAQGYLFFNSVIPFAVCISVAPVLACTKDPRKTTTSTDMDSGFMLMFAITLITGVYAVASSLAKTVATVDITVTIALLISAPAAFLVQTLRISKALCLSKDQHRLENDEESSIGSPTIKQMEESQETGETAGAVEAGGEEKEDSGVGQKEMGWKEMVKTCDFVLLFLVCLFGQALGLVFLSNLGQIAVSRGVSAKAYLLPLFFSSSFFGRLLPPFVDYKLSRHVRSRPGLMAMFMAAMAAAFFSLADQTHISLGISTAVIGACAGAITCLSVSTTVDLFGTENFGVNYNILNTYAPVGSLLFGSLAAYFHYRTNFVVWGSVCSFGTLLAFALYARTRTFYSPRS